MSLCKATSKRTKKPCGAQAVTGRDLCYHHGGKNPRGVDSPRFKTGRYSEVYREDLRARYEALVSDPDLLSTREEIAAVVVRLDALLERWQDAGTPSKEDRAWGQIDRALHTLAKLREVELKREEKLNAFMSLDQLRAFMLVLGRSVQEQITSGKSGQVLIEAIHRDINAAVPALPGPPATEQRGG